MTKTNPIVKEVWASILVVSIDTSARIREVDPLIMGFLARSEFEEYIKDYRECIRE